MRGGGRRKGKDDIRMILLNTSLDFRYVSSSPSLEPNFAFGRWSEEEAEEEAERRPLSPLIWHTLLPGWLNPMVDEEGNSQDWYRHHHHSRRRHTTTSLSSMSAFPRYCHYVATPKR